MDTSTLAQGVRAMNILIQLRYSNQQITPLQYKTYVQSVVSDINIWRCFQVIHQKLTLVIQISQNRLNKQQLVHTTSEIKSMGSYALCWLSKKKKKEQTNLGINSLTLPFPESRKFILFHSLQSHCKRNKLFALQTMNKIHFASTYKPLGAQNQMAAILLAYSKARYTGLRRK